VVYDDVSSTRRADLHQRVAERLGGVPPERPWAISAELAPHLKGGRARDRAFEYYVQAGDNSMTLSAGREAEGHYNQAIALAERESARIEPSRTASARYKAQSRASFSETISRRSPTVSKL